MLEIAENATMPRPNYKQLFHTTIEENPFNWLRSLKLNEGFMAWVTDKTRDLPEDMPLKDRIYSACTGQSPVCKNGNMRSLKNVYDGWKGCGRTGACACANELVSASIRATKADNRAVVVDTALSPEVEIGDAKDRLLAIIAAYPPKSVSKVASGDPGIVAWVNEQCKYVESSSGKFSELMYLALNGTSDLICKRGQKKIFNTFQKGYRFCANDCACRREAQAAAMRDHYADLSLEERERRNNAYDATMIATHGVSNAAHVAGATEKKKQTNLLRYGFEFAQSAPQVIEKQTATNKVRYGGRSPASDPAVRAKQQQTNMDRYGVPHTMTSARAAFMAQTGVANPFMMPEYQAKAKATMLEKYGTEHALRVPSILKKMLENTTNGNSRSLGELYIEDWLIGRGITYQPQFQIPPHYHPYDFYLPDYNLIIEFDGAYHWERPIYAQRNMGIERELTEEEKDMVMRGQAEKDALRNARAWAAGYKIICVLGSRWPGDSEHGSLEEQLEKQGFVV